MASYKKISANNKQGYKYICTIEGPPDPLTGKRNQIARRGNTQKEALARCEAALEELAEVGGVKAKTKERDVKFGELGEEWLGVYSIGDRKPGTIRIRKIELKHLNKRFGNAVAKNITPKMYQDFLIDLDKEGLARTTIEGIDVTAGMIFKYGLQQKIFKEDPTANAVIPTKLLTVEQIENNSIEESYLEENELTEFLEAVKKYGLPLDVEMFYLLAFSGFRVGEMCALKWYDDNFETNEIRISKTLYNPNNNQHEYELLTPKTKASIRIVGIDPTVNGLLKKHKELMAVILGDDQIANCFIFCRENGTPYVPKTVGRRMQRILDKTKIKKKATPHIFRHTHISMLTQANVDLATIMQRVGHDDMQTTLKIYTHVTNKMKKDANEKIHKHFEKLLTF